MVGLQQKRKPGKPFQKRGRKIPILIPVKKQDKLWSSTQPAPRYTLDYKNTKLLVKFISPQGKILSRRVTRLSAKQQRLLAKTIKRARMSVLLPFVNLDTPRG